MEENKDYRAYRYGDYLEPGAELKIEHSVSCEDVDISSLITMGAENLEAMRQGSIDGEQKAYEIVVAAAKGKAGSRHADDQPGAFLPANPGGDAYRK